MKTTLLAWVIALIISALISWITGSSMWAWALASTVYVAYITYRDRKKVLCKHDFKRVDRIFAMTTHDELKCTKCGTIKYVKL